MTAREFVALRQRRNAAREQSVRWAKATPHLKGLNARLRLRFNGYRQSVLFEG